MRFKIGSKVEVLCKKDVSVGAWRCAEIICDGGDTYRVKCEPISGMSSGKVLEGVPKANIRPCPPRAESETNWAPGDILEVLDGGSWKTATVLNVMERYFYLIRILGSFQEFKVNTFKTRLRQTWKDGKWVVLGKDYGSNEFAKSSNIFDLICCEVPQSDTKIKFSAGKETNHLQDSYVVSARSLKRASPFCSSYVEPYPSKVRAIERHMANRQVVSRLPSSPLNEVVDIVASPENSLGEEDMHASFGNQTFGNIDIERESLDGASSCYFERSIGFSDSDDSNDADTCSVVASCSVNSNNMNELCSNVLAGPSQDAGTDCCSDAESFCGWRDDEEKCDFPLLEEAPKVRRLELHAYRSTMVAIHASGPLSWEKEELLTNLRIALHISNDEHLMEVRNLISCRSPLSLLADNQ